MEGQAGYEKLTEWPGRLKSWAGQKGRHKGDHTEDDAKPGHGDRDGIYFHFVCDATACPPSSPHWYPAVAHTCDPYLALRGLLRSIPPVLISVCA